MVFLLGGETVFWRRASLALMRAMVGIGVDFDK